MAGRDARAKRFPRYHPLMTDSHNDQVIDQFTQQAAGYAALTKAVPGDRAAAFRALVGVKPDDIALDICCGTGAIALGLAPYVASMTGIDLTPAMLAQARVTQAERGIGPIDWVEGDARTLPFADAGFSLVLCGAAFHHLEAPEQVLAEMARVCRPGGRVVVRDVTPDARTNAAYDRIERLRDPSHHHALTPEELRGLGEGLALSMPVIATHVTADLSFDAILATSHPEKCTRDDLLGLMREDAEEGADRLGFAARLIDGRVHVSYPMTIAVWTRT